jgi:Protein tyrosine and serine/threonine kinase
MGHHYNVKADVYSWTMVLHAMLSLQRPFEMYNAQLHSLLVCQEGVRPTIHNDWPLPIQQLLRQGWAGQPGDRPRMGQVCQTLRDLLHEIDTARASAPDPPAGAAPAGQPSNADETFVSFLDSWASTLCAGPYSNPKGAAAAGKRAKRSLLRSIEAHLVADTAGTQLLMLREHSRRDRMGTADYPQLMHLRSSYL